jgi:recombinational DNA repair protein RecR
MSFLLQRKYVKIFYCSKCDLLTEERFCPKCFSELKEYKKALISNKPTFLPY